MIVSKLADYLGGWIVGNYNGKLIKTDAFEFGVKRIKAHTIDEKHVHKEADEITVIISGRVLFNGVEYGENSVILVKKGEPMRTITITDAVVAVIKTPAVNGDKHEVQ